jgi:diguanylate cyclase (GGDEF)-like protein/PAS domain S-box-containing protein
MNDLGIRPSDPSAPHGVHPLDAAEVVHYLDHIRVGFVVLRDGALLYANSRARDLLPVEGELTFESLMGLQSRTVGRDGHRFPPEGGPVARALASGDDVVDEVLGIVDPDDGQTLWLLVTVRQDDDGSVVISANDISRRIAAEDALQERTRQVEAREQHLSRLFEMSLVALSEVGLDTRYQRVNPAFCELTGYTREELESMRIADLTHPDDAVRDLEAARGLMAGEIDSYVTDKRYRHKDGHWVWVALRATVVRDDDGTPLHFLGQSMGIGERKRYEELLRSLAEYDPLTRLPNRRGFERELERHAALASRGAPAGSVLYVDLDGFKEVNDRHGHSVGDQLLRTTAVAISERIRNSDVVARIGGDEFAVLLTSGDAEDAQRVASTLLAAITDAAAAVLPDATGASASIGVAPFDASAPGASLGAADTAMYRAKRDGKGRWAVADPPRRAGT